MDRAKFYAALRTDPRMPNHYNASQVEGFEHVLDTIDGQPLAYQAYMLATPWWETGQTMQPVREAFNLGEAWRKAHLRYYPWYGRGYVQVTWETNYKKLDAEAAKRGLIKPGELLANADLAMRPDIAALALREGMLQGWFTGVKMSTFLPAAGMATRVQYMHARRIINGNDRADLIEDFAQAFEKALRAGGLS